MEEEEIVEDEEEAEEYEEEEERGVGTIFKALMADASANIGPASLQRTFGVHRRSTYLCTLREKERSSCFLPWILTWLSYCNLNLVQAYFACRVRQLCFSTPRE